MNPLLKLLASNRGQGQFRAESGDEEDTLYLYDVIVSDDFWGGVSDSAFVRKLNSLTAPVIHLRINSPGGDVFAARAMEQAIREHPSRIVSHIDGLAASAASYVSTAADEVLISEGGFYMIHKAWTIAFGNSDDMLHAGGLLEKIDESLVRTYARETGQNPDQIRDWLGAETWFDAEEAVEFGFVDAISEPIPKASNHASARVWDLSAYQHAPEQNLEELEPTGPTGDPESEQTMTVQPHTAGLRRYTNLVERVGTKKQYFKAA